VANRDLLRKHFALGVVADEGTTVGMYIWPSVAWLGGLTPERSDAGQSSRASPRSHYWQDPVR
jgi:hypothetical protein